MKLLSMEFGQKQKYRSGHGENRKYLMCELVNLSCGKKKLKVFICSESDDSMNSKNELWVSAGSGLGINCLIAVANGEREFEVKGVEYRIIKSVQYDADYVSQYIEG